jgi:hypothetical protein
VECGKASALNFVSNWHHATHDKETIRLGSPFLAAQATPASEIKDFNARKETGEHPRRTRIAGERFFGSTEGMVSGPVNKMPEIGKSGPAKIAIALMQTGGTFVICCNPEKRKVNLKNDHIREIRAKLRVGQFPFGAVKGHSAVPRTDPHL